ncbi:hypothetical protein SAMN05421820_101524 [Pedobacter steynii]|uniref:Preprotein translocase subunit SecB n=1 Tax=Pedobacter steynii TaxID=430522 RepID=A0A1G9KAT6_9SPHI|nr:hypothetical protein [Pedobacter steynii]NQX38500.1 hypothetical protein [Pedobacter steynii]SDL46888.1 hypothetical protein SAMN05421820_101524 [Pedobacter steynii]
MSKSQNQEILYHLSSIELIGTELSIPADFTSKETYDYDVNVESRLNHKNQMVRLKLEIQIKAGEIRYGSLSSVFWYSIANYDKVFMKNKSGIYKIPDGLLLSLNAISISTARGMLFSAFRGTALHNALLPIIDAKDFLQPH